MATIHEKYEFFLNVPGVGAQQVYPTAKKLTWKWDRSNKFPRKTLSSSLIFYDDSTEDISDFSLIYPLERERRRCDRMTLTINQICNGGSSEFWQGYFYISDGEWNVSGCQVTVKPETLDDYQCVLDRWDEVINLLEYGTPVEVRDTYGEIQYVTCTATRFSEGRISPRDPVNFDFFHAADCLDEPNSATRLSNRVEINTLSDGRKQYDIETLYAREFVAGATPPPGIGWIAVTGGYARPVDAFLVEDEDGNETYEVARFGSIPNAVLFNEVMENVFGDFCPQVNLISNYFGINPDGTNPDNQWYQTAQTHYQELYFIPKSEILFFGASDRATATPEVTLKKLLNDLKIIHGVELRVRDGVAYLEHESYFKGNATLNLREDQFEFYLKGNFKYRYINQEIPRIEKFLFADVTDEIGDFDYSTIEYQPCSTVQGEEKNYKCEVISTNIAEIVKSGKKDDGRVSPNGVALVAAEDKIISFATGAISGKAIVNGTLAFPFIIENNLSYRRPLKEGLFNGQFLEFARAWPSRRWTGRICMSCEDIQQFDMEDLVQTVLAWGEVEEATFDEPDGMLELTVNHE